MTGVKPIIAITAKTEELRNRQQVTLPEAYGKAIEDAGGIPVIIPIINYKPNISEIGRFADGFLFSGGDDIHPRNYGEELILKLTLSPDDRTEFEIALFNEALRLRKPMLGVCLGAQLINVALGGSLYQDIPTQVPKHLDHRAEHPVFIKEGTLLHRIFNIPPTLMECGKGKNRDTKVISTLGGGNLSPHDVGDFSRSFLSEVSVISAHHQAINSLGKWLSISASSSDGVIEAIEMADYPFLIGVQWHPERSPEDKYTRRLFKAFVEIAGRK